MPLKIGAVIDGSITSAIDGGKVTWAPDPRALTDLAQGTSSSMVDLAYQDTRTIAASGTYNLDLSGTQDTNVFGVSLAFVKVKSIYVKAAAANTNNVIVGAGTNPFVGPLGGTTPTITLPPGGELLLTAPVGGWTVTAATADILKFANSSSGTGVDFDVIITGTSA